MKNVNPAFPMKILKYKMHEYAVVKFALQKSDSVVTEK